MVVARELDTELDYLPKLGKKHKHDPYDDTAEDALRKRKADYYDCVEKEHIRCLEELDGVFFDVSFL